MFKLRSILSDFVLLGCIFCVSQLAIWVGLFTNDAFAFWKSCIENAEKFTSIIPSDLRVLTNGLALGLILLLFMGTGLCLDMIASASSPLEANWFAKNIERNFGWWKQFAARYREYVGDTEALLEYSERSSRRGQSREGIRASGEFAFCKEVFNSENISARGKLFYGLVLLLLVPTIPWILVVRSLSKIPVEFRARSIYLNQQRRIQDFLLSFATSFADATKGDLLPDEIRVWRLNRTISLVLFICFIELMAKYSMVSWSRLSPFVDVAPEGLIPVKMLQALVPLIAAEFIGLAALIAARQLVLKRAYERLCAMLFAATYVGYIKLKKDDEDDGRDGPAETQLARAPCVQPHTSARAPLPSAKRLRLYKSVGACGWIVAIAAGVAFEFLDYSRSSVLRGYARSLGEVQSIYSQLSADAGSLDQRREKSRAELQEASEKMRRLGSSPSQERDALQQRVEKATSESQKVVADSAALVRATEQNEARGKSLSEGVDLAISRSKEFDRRWGALYTTSFFLFLAGGWTAASGFGLSYLFSERMRKKVQREPMRQGAEKVPSDNGEGAGTDKGPEVIA